MKFSINGKNASVSDLDTINIYTSIVYNTKAIDLLLKFVYE